MLAPSAEAAAGAGSVSGEELADIEPAGGTGFPDGTELADDTEFPDDTAAVADAVVSSVTSVLPRCRISPRPALPASVRNLQ